MSVVITGAIVGASAALVGQIIVHVFTARRERVRQEHERELKELELEEKRQERLRDERIRAYTNLLSITATIQTDEPYRIDDLAEALSTIQLVAGSDKARTTADALHDYSLKARKKGRAVKKSGGNLVQDPDFLSAHQSVMVTREAFLEASREELRLPPKAPPTGLSAHEIIVPADE